MIINHAAAVPVCGALDTTNAALINSLPIWTYHGSNDGVVPPFGTRTIMKKFISLGNIVVFPKCGQNIESCTPLTEQQLLMNLSSAKKLYTELAGVGHNAWDYAFVDSMMFKWVFLQSKAQPTAVSPRHITNYQLTKYTDREILSFHPVKTELSYMITGKTIKATGKFGTGIYITKPVQR